MGRILIKSFIISIFCLAVGLFVVYFFILPPKVISTIPSPDSEEVSLRFPITIRFNKPVKRQELQHRISPEAYGEWKFENPIVKNHLYKAVVFTPALDLEPNTRYQVQLENIISPLGIGFSGDFSFSFQTQTISSGAVSEEETEKETEAEELEEPKKSEPNITLLNITLDWQDYSLSCEAASLKMALAWKGIYVSEEEIMEKIGFDLTPRHNNVWGDPYKTYVGVLDGKICQTGYGVYWEPVGKAANSWEASEAFSDWNLKDLIREIELGNPVLVWGTLPVETLRDCSWYTPEGKFIEAFKETHVRLVVGFIGEAENPSQIILNDPLAGRLYWTTSFFLTNWRVFDYSGVVIR